MKRRFKSKKRKHFNYILFILLLSLSLIINRFIIKNNYLKYVTNNKEIYKLNIDKDNFLYKLSFNKDYITTTNKIITTTKVKEKQVFKEVIRPKVYIYNTHNKEDYNGYDVQKATSYLCDNLKNLNIECVYDKYDTVGELNKRNLDYKNAYTITRELLNKKLSNNYDIIIDLHRDSVPKYISTTKIKNKSYAKIMFVIGTNHSNYKYNYDLADNLDKGIKNINKTLSRSILVRNTAKYNQDINKNIILIELGGNENTREEINNSVIVLSKVIAEYLKE